MDEIEHRRRNLLLALSNCEAISNEISRGAINADGELSATRAERFLDGRDQLFEKARKHVRDLEFKDMDDFEWAIRSFVLGLRKLRIEVLSEQAVSANDFNFYDDFSDLLENQALLPVLQKVRVFLEENRKLMPAIGVLFAAAFGAGGLAFRILLCP